ncbi:MAG: enoyl-CoA hydratase/isomerase family protein [Deltaproteobacteria bacterium]|nr:enoyl-CoA hydratase/isomerase family protein [Deltaproteobacteria bacterium]
MTATIGQQRQGDVMVLTLANEAKRNALTPALCRELADAVRALEPAGVRAAVLTGAGNRAFSAGFDLGALDHPDASAVDNPFDPLVDTVAASPVPLVCALNGGVFGGGLELAATCDLRVAHPGVKLAIPPARLGIIYSARGLSRMSALVGESRARELFLTARTLDAAEAHAWRLIDHVVPEAEVLPRALALAGDMAALAPLAVQGMRRSFEALLAQRLRLAPEVAAALAAAQEAAWRSEDAVEGRRAMAEKRPPVFRGR